MSFLSNINPIKPLVNAALGSTGLGSVLNLASRNLVSSFGQSLIQKIGDNLHLPQPMIDAAQGAFAMSHGDVLGGIKNTFEAAEGFAKAAGGSMTDAADFGRQIMDNITKIAADIAGGQDAKDAKAGGKGGSWLMAMARALGEKADKLADQMSEMADKMSAENSKPSDSLEFSAKSQEFSLFMNSANNALKTAGESLTTAARKGS